MQSKLQVFFIKGSTYEGRAFSKDTNKHPNAVFYATSSKDFYDKAKKYDNDNYKAVYFIPNPVASDQPAKFEETKKASVAEDILERRWILVDCDPIRPSEFKAHSATEKEKAAAKLLMEKTYELLKGLGYKGLVVSDSGNGYHIMIPVKLPNTTISKNKIQSFLKGVASRTEGYSPGARIDTNIFDAGRLCKLYGTTARKGVSTEDRPYRKSTILKTEFYYYNEEASIANISSLERTLRLWNTLDVYMNGKDTKPLTTVERARLYIAKEEPAIAGDAGSSKCFHVASILVEGFGIDNWVEFKEAISEWNLKCQPPWNDKELKHKFEDALKKRSPARVGRLNTKLQKLEKKEQATKLLDHLPLKSLRGALDLAQYKNTSIIPTINKAGYYYYNPEDEDTQPATLLDVARECKELKWIWKDWLMENIIHIIAADPKVGKTRFIADLIRRIQHQTVWPDGEPIEGLDAQTRFLMVLADGNHAELVSTAVEFGLDSSCIYFPAPKKDPFLGKSLDSLEDWVLIDEWISIIQPKFLVVDTVTYVTGKNLNTPEEAIKFINPLQELVQKHGVTVLCLCHTNLRGESLGRRLTGAARILLKIEKQEDDVDNFTENDIITQNKRVLYVNATNFKEPDFKLEMQLKTEGIDYEKIVLKTMPVDKVKLEDTILTPVKADEMYAEDGKAYYEPGRLRAVPVPGKNIDAVRLPDKLKEGSVEVSEEVITNEILVYLDSKDGGVHSKTLREHLFLKFNQCVTEDSFYKVLYRLAEEEQVKFSVYSTLPEGEEDKINFWQIIGIKNASKEKPNKSSSKKGRKSSSKKRRTSSKNSNRSNGRSSTNGTYDLL